MREAVKTSLLVGDGGAHEGLEVVGVLPQRFLGSVLLEVFCDFSKFLQRLRNHLEAIVERPDLAWSETFSGGELLYLEVVFLDGAFCYFNSKLDDVLLGFDLCGDLGVASYGGIA
ncbi:hypothetical protein HanIR_Chr09g0450551 [Helianthus annuus]|nr:hypothetical protein HanIR_Chr09g0450551 [Helianthus annuus]